MVTGANDNGTYHLVVGKRIKAFKKRHNGDLDLGDSDSEHPESEDELMDEEPEPGPVFSNQNPIMAHTGGCREENHPRAQSVHNACEPALHACAPFFVYSRELGTKGIRGS